MNSTEGDPKPLNPRVSVLGTQAYSGINSTEGDPKPLNPCVSVLETHVASCTWLQCAHVHGRVGTTESI